MQYYLKQSVFALKEEMSGFVHALASLALYPFMALVLTVVWSRYTASSGSFSFAELLRYIGITELLYLTSFRMVSGGWAQADFSTSLARPRKWLLTYFSSFIGSSTGKRFVYLALFMGVFSMVGGGSLNTLLLSALRFLMLMPLLAIAEALYSLLLCVMELILPQSTAYRLLLGKVFLVCGGVIAPLSEVKGTFGELLRSSPWSDLVFQVGYFCVRGSFYQLSAQEWFFRVIVHLAVLFLVVLSFYSIARRWHESLGG